MEGIRLINPNAKELNLEIDEAIKVAEDCFKEKKAKFRCNFRKITFLHIACLAIPMIIVFIIGKEFNLFYIMLSYFHALLIVMISMAIIFISSYVVKKDMDYINNLSEDIESLKWLKTKTPTQKRWLIEFKNSIIK